MNRAGLIIKHLVITGPQVKPAQLEFGPGLNLVYGASNTGKSFTLKAIDFMLGGKDILPDIDERKGYDQIWLGITLYGHGDLTLSRSISGGAFELYKGLIKADNSSARIETLAPTQNTKKNKSLSQFLLDSLGLSGKLLAKNANGETDQISFRDVCAISLVDETSIQSENSPIESGEKLFRSKERSFFRMLLTGLDDSAIISVEDPKIFNASKAVRIEVVQEMLDVVEDKLSIYPDIDDLPAQNDRLSTSLEKIQSEFNEVQGSIRSLIEEKQSLSIEIPKLGQRIEEIQIHLERFAQLDEVYASDIERLGALEEAGFLIELESKKECPLCGAPADAQTHIHDFENVNRIQNAAILEIKKIESQREDLKSTISNLKFELLKHSLDYPTLSSRLDEVEREINRLAPRANENKATISEVISARDEVKQGLLLISQRNSLTAKLEEFKNLKKPSKDDKPNLKTPDLVTHQLCKIVSEILKAWEFPGECQVSFDDKTYDLKIDGKLRINNGKGVRAVTHSAFKIALLVYCRRNNLPHPGFVILDTPLLTYRDPIKNTKAGELSDDEKVIAKSSLKEKFFEYLSSIETLGQFIILENIDPPPGVEKYAHVQTFYGDEVSGRDGFFPKN